MADHNDHGPIATHPILLVIAGLAFLVLMGLGFQLKASANHSGAHPTVHSGTDSTMQGDGH